MDGAYFVGASKKDIDNHKAQVVGKLSNFKKGEDRVEVLFANSNPEQLIILLNGNKVYNSILPGLIKSHTSKVSTQRGNKAKVEIKLEKERPGAWVDKWSPTRNDPSSSVASLAGTDSLSSESRISLPKFFPDNEESKNKNVNSIS